MKIKEPLELRNQLADKQAYTYEDIAKSIGISTRTVYKMFNGFSIRPATAQKIAKFLGTDVANIVEYVK